MGFSDRLAVMERAIVREYEIICYCMLGYEGVKWCSASEGRRARA